MVSVFAVSSQRIGNASTIKVTSIAGLPRASCAKSFGPVLDMDEEPRRIRTRRGASTPFASAASRAAAEVPTRSQSACAAAAAARSPSISPGGALRAATRPPALPAFSAATASRCTIPPSLCNNARTHAASRIRRASCPPWAQLTSFATCPPLTSASRTAGAAPEPPSRAARHRRVAVSRAAASELKSRARWIPPDSSKIRGADASSAARFLAASTSSTLAASSALRRASSASLRLRSSSDSR
mmetsp:Transcript_25986/g.79020  ORF Transcript_25986/g.79020 Transcript_25986/m.79020 type:complete len:243 (+) Transcript_25986:1511-2239(+)